MGATRWRRSDADTKSKPRWRRVDTMSDKQERRLPEGEAVTDYLNPDRQVDVKLSVDVRPIREVLARALHALVDAMVDNMENPHVGRAEGLVGHLIVDRELAKANGDEYAEGIFNLDSWEHTVHTRDDRYYRVLIQEVPDDLPRRGF
jgi:hypothetical protein